MAQETYFRPPSEADSFIIRVMHGCPHNKCAFCNLFKGVPYRPLPLEEVLVGLDQDALELGERLGAMVTSIYLEGGDPLALRTETLLRIMSHAKTRFPNLTRFACYATARSVVSKMQDELNALGEAGLQRVFVGLESGCDALLERDHKGCTAADLRRAGVLLAAARIELDVSLMLGLGGPELSSRHALETAALLNDLAPACVRIRTLVPKEGTELGREFAEGGFALMDPYAILRELRLMVSQLHAPMLLRSEHWSDYIHFEAQIPEAREALLELIAKNLKLPEARFRPTGLYADKS